MDSFLGAGNDIVSLKDELLDVENGERGKKTKGLPHGIKPSKKKSGRTREDAFAVQIVV